MSPIATALKHMLAAGMAHDAIVAAVAELETLAAVDPQAERRRERDRERKAAVRRLPQTSADSVESADPSQDKEVSPVPPSRKPNPPVSITTREADLGFSRFWDEYPRKVAKPDALKAYTKALKNIPGPDPPGVILAGLRTQLPAWAVSEPEFIPHPATWLNRDGWNDQPAPPRPRQANGQRPHTNGPAERSAERLGRIFAGAQVAAGAGRHGLGD